MRACNQLGQFLSNRETNLRYLALESMCLLANSEFSHEAVKKHQEVVILSMKVSLSSICITSLTKQYDNISHRYKKYIIFIYMWYFLKYQKCTGKKHII